MLLRLGKGNFTMPLGTPTASRPSLQTLYGQSVIRRARGKFRLLPSGRKYGVSSKKCTFKLTDRVGDVIIIIVMLCKSLIGDMQSSHYNGYMCRNMHFFFFNLVFSVLCAAFGLSLMSAVQTSFSAVCKCDVSIFMIYIHCMYWLLCCHCSWTECKANLRTTEICFILSFLSGHRHYMQDAMASTRTSGGEEAAQTASLADRWTPDHQQHGGAPSC